MKIYSKYLHSQTKKKLGTWHFDTMFTTLWVSNVTCQVSGARCQVSGVRCWVSGVRCQVSGVTCQVSHVKFQVFCVTCQVSCVTCHLSVEKRRRRRKARKKDNIVNAMEQLKASQSLKLPIWCRKRLFILSISFRLFPRHSQLRATGVRKHADNLSAWP